MTCPPSGTQAPSLQRQVGLYGAVSLGLGSIVGTGVFISIGLAAGLAGPGVLIAIGLAAVVATCNGLSSAQLAASHPVSGGTYEYGYRYATPPLGFVAGWLFLWAKSASAATAALGLAGYILNTAFANRLDWLVPLALAAVLLLTLLVLSGLQRSNRVNAVLVGLTLSTLVVFILGGLPSALAKGAEHLSPVLPNSKGAGWSDLLHATALMFVAYTGYGRIATLGEEVKNPRRTIPRAIITTLGLSMVLYMAVGAVALAAVGSEAYFAAATHGAAPLEIIAQTFGQPGIPWVLTLGALTAMAGVLLNLLMGLSRVLLAMGRRADMPAAAARLDRGRTTPYVAVASIGLIVGALVLIGDVKTTWSFSAFTVLVYYALTNYCALRLPPDARLYPRWISSLGLVACSGLAFFLDSGVVFSGLALILAGLAWHWLARRRAA